MAKRFDYESIYNRRQRKALEMGELKSIVGNGIFDTLLKTESYGEAELARYMEYLLQERKFTTARNLSSVLAQADLVCYKRSLPISAQGFVIVTHTDNNGVSRANNYLKTFSDIDSASDFDNIVQNESASTLEKSTLVPWTSTKIYSIPKGTVFTSDSGIKYFSTEEKYIKTWNKEYSQIEVSDLYYKEFLNNGAWENYKYLKVPVIQGIQKEEPIGISDGTPNQVFKFNSTQVEDASNSVSKEFFYITVELNGVSDRWEEIYSVAMAESLNVFSKKILADSSGIEIKFGNGSSGNIPPKDAKIVLHYVETLGAAGDNSRKNSIKSIAFSNSDYSIDPRTGVLSNFIQCFNNAEVLGGKDIETFEEIKENAPLGFLKYKSLSTSEDYAEVIKKRSPVSLMHLQVYRDFSQAQNEIIDNICIPKKYNNIIYYTGLKFTGEPLSIPEAQLITTTISSAVKDVKLVGDDLVYIEPEIVDFDLDLDIKRKTLSSLTLNEIRAQIFNNYSIFSYDFNKPLISSEIIDLVKDERLDYVEANLNVLGRVDSVNLDGTLVNLSISFSEVAKNLKKLSSVEDNIICKVDIQSNKNALTVLLIPTSAKIQELKKDSSILSIQNDESYDITKANEHIGLRNARFAYNKNMTNKNYQTVKNSELRRYYQDSFNKNTTSLNTQWVPLVGFTSFNHENSTGVFSFEASSFLPENIVQTITSNVISDNSLKTIIMDNLEVRVTLMLDEENIYPTSNKMIFNIKNTNISEF